VKYNAKANIGLLSLMKESTSELVRELVTRNLRISSENRLSIDKMMLKELKIIQNSGRLIL